MPFHGKFTVSSLQKSWFTHKYTGISDIIPTRGLPIDIIYVYFEILVLSGIRIFVSELVGINVGIIHKNCCWVCDGLSKRVKRVSVFLKTSRFSEFSVPISINYKPFSYPKKISSLPPTVIKSSIRKTNPVITLRSLIIYTMGSLHYTMFHRIPFSLYLLLLNFVFARFSSSK